MEEEARRQGSVVGDALAQRWPAATWTEQNCSCFFLAITAIIGIICGPCSAAIRSSLPKPVYLTFVAPHFFQPPQAMTQLLTDLDFHTLVFINADIPHIFLAVSEKGV
jgi:hypothetical protein